MEPDDHEKDIPIWFNGTQRWMAGLTRRTTCDDIIYAILYSSGLHEAEATDNFAIFEKWREVERPLSSRTKILKVWAFWGEEQPNVSLSMRSLNDYFLPGESSLYMRSKRRHKRQSKHRSSRHSPTCKCHDRRSCAECSRLKSLEHLVKLVVSQERKLQDITDHIVDTDRLIEKHEGRIHEHRVQQNGFDYVLESYLNSHSSGSSSSVDSACLSVATLDLNEARGVFSESSLAELGEITRMCDQLTHLERRLAVEKAKEEELEIEVGKLRQERGQEVKEGEIKNAGVEEARVELLRAVTSHVTQEYNERMLDRRMETCLADVQDRAAFLQALQSQLAEVESLLVPSKGNERLPLEDLSQTNHLQHLSRGGDGDVFTTSHLLYESQQTHGLTNQTATDQYNHSTPPQKFESIRQSQHLPQERIASKYSENTTNTRGRDLEPVGASQSNSQPKPPSKSMTGRGRFAREPVHTGVDSSSSTNSVISHREQTHPTNTDNLIGPSDGNYSSLSFPNPYTTGQNYVHPSASSSLPNTRDGQSLTCGGEDNIDSTNTGRAGEINSTGVKVHSNAQSWNAATSYQISETVLGFGGNSVVYDSRGRGSWKNSTPKFSGIGKALQNSAVNSTGSCGDLSRMDNSSPSLGVERSNREGRPMFMSRGRGEQKVGQSTSYRRSRSADRETSHSQGHSARVNTKGQRQLTHQYSNREDQTMDINTNFRVDPSPMKTGGYNQQSIQYHSTEKNLSRPNNGKFNLSPGNIPDAPASSENHGLLSKINTNSSQNIGTDNLFKPAKAMHQHQTQNNNSNQQHRSGHGFSSLFEQNKPAGGQNSQIVSNKTPRKTTGFIFRVADQNGLGVPANSPSGNATGKDESSSPQNGYCLRTSHDLGAGSRGVQDSNVKNGALFAHRIPGDSLNTHTRNSSSPSYNNFSVRPQTSTDMPSQADDCSVPTKDVSALYNNQSKQRLQDPTSDSSPPAPANTCNTNSIETNPSRGALYHIVSQKLNASKEKIRLTSMQDTVKDKAEGNTGASSNNENQRNLRQPQNQGIVLNDNTRTSATGHMTNGASQSWHHKQQFSAPGTTSRNLTTVSGQGGRSFVLATSTETAPPPSNNSPQQTPAPSSSHNLPPTASATISGSSRSANGGTNRNLQQNNPVAFNTFNDAGRNSFPQPSQYNNSQQHYQHNQTQQHHLNQAPTYQLQSQEQTPNSLHMYQSNQRVGIPQQQQQQQQQQRQYHHQNGNVFSSFNHLNSNTASDQPIEPNELQTVGNTPYRRSALNPHFYDMNNTSAKVTSRSAPKKPLLNGSTGLINYHENDNPNGSIMSYLKHSNNGFLENLKSSTSPVSLGLPSRSINISASSNNSSKVPGSSVLTPFPNSDPFDINEPRKTKSKMEDSNDSDTGLSSMHSDETANMETLV